MVCTSKLGVGALIVSVSLNAYAADPRSTREDTKTTQRSPDTTHLKSDLKLDLRTPSITRIFTQQQIEMVLARATDPELEHVEVEASRISDVPFVDNSASGTQAAFKEVVRWFAPYPTTRAAQVNASPDATAPYRPAPILLSAYHASFSPPYSQR